MPKTTKKTEKEIKDGLNQEADQAETKTNNQESAKVTAEPKVAKAGKRSAKALKEAADKQAKEERKTNKSDETETPVKPKANRVARPKHERAGKKYRESYKLIDRNKEYDLKEAVELAVKTSPTKFDASVELHARLNVDPKLADQNIRDNLVLPAGTGKTVRVAVFADADQVAVAKKAGADIAGADEFLQQLDKGKIDFDILVATPNVMPKLGKYARILGPKGLMPNPKSGTVTANVAKAVSDAKAGRVEYRVDSQGIVHVAAGKVSFGTDKLIQNLEALFGSLKAAKPGSVKGIYVRSVYLTTTMGPSIKLKSNVLGN